MLVESEPCRRFTSYRLRPEVLDTPAGAVGALADDARRAQKRACG